MTQSKPTLEEFIKNNPNALDDIFKNPNLIDQIKTKVREPKPCMALHVAEEYQYVELILDTSKTQTHEWIKGEGGDISIIRDTETGKVIGAHLPLYKNNLAIYHEGPIKINEGYYDD